MSQYYDLPEKLSENGTRVQLSYETSVLLDVEDWKGAFDSLTGNGNQTVYALLYSFQGYKVAPLIDNADELKLFYLQYFQMMYRKIEFFRL